METREQAGGVARRVTRGEPELRVTGDGSHTLYLPWMDEHYHSLFGAVTESKHLFIGAGLEYLISKRESEGTVPQAGIGSRHPDSGNSASKYPDSGSSASRHPDSGSRDSSSGRHPGSSAGKPADDSSHHSKPLTILEAGFGTGLNALLTALYATEHRSTICYLSLETSPLPMELINRLNYGSLTGEEGMRLFTEIHETPWNSPIELNEWFTLEKRITDLTTEGAEGAYDLIYFDPFGPDKQPAMWSSDVMARISGMSHPGTVLVTYSAKGEVKRKLKRYGFEVTLLPGPRGKRVITRAVKK